MLERFKKLLLNNSRVKKEILVLSLPLARTLESQLTAEQSSTGRHRNSPKKIPHIIRQRRSHSETVGGVQSQ